AYNRPMPIYLDHAATTPLRSEALEAMLPYLGGAGSAGTGGEFGNPSSPHGFGRRARAALDEAHERIGKAINAGPREIVLTSGGTEAINLALKGAAWAGKARGHRIVTSAVEHHAVLHSLQHLEKFGFEIVELPVDRYGRVDPDQVAAAITERTTVVAIQMANNEVGTVQPVEAIGKVVRERASKGCLFLVDAVAAAAWLPIDVEAIDCDLLAVAGHKIDGPKGIGALYLRKGVHILAQTHGGTQERYRRAGTENVAGAVGMGVAFELAVAERAATAKRVKKLRDRLQSAVLEVDGLELTGHPRERLPNLLSVIVGETDSASIVVKLDLEGLAASVGSACTTGSTEPSHVLTAMGYPDDEARGSLRMSLGRSTTDAEIDAAIDLVPRVLADARAVAAVLAADPLGQAIAS
ncbi:MAG TPA: cysteine desulfurase family protein, partial [Candidatus Limnocylindrales bacterium]|nr:cysteine desulfurase family protein [Candidatus Limnocylindrales bacterium]